MKNLRNLRRTKHFHEQTKNTMFFGKPKNTQEKTNKSNQETQQKKQKENKKDKQKQVIYCIEEFVCPGGNQP